MYIYIYKQTSNAIKQQFTMGMSTTKFTSNLNIGYYKPIWNGKCLILESNEAGAINLVPVSLSLILIPCLIWTWVIPFNSDNNIISIVIMCVSVWGLVINAVHKLFVCYTTEPGIIPFKEVDAPLEEGITETYKKRVLIVDGEEVELKSKRAKICRQTNTAIEKFDHYCPWTGNAIGRRNYPYFFGFICSTTLLSLIVFVTSVICIFGQTGAKGGFTRYMESNTYIVTVQVIVSIYAIILFLTLVGLTTYHINLVCRNVTTNEDLKGVYSLNKINEHDEGMLKNINSILFSPTPPSKVKEGNNNNMTNPLMNNASVKKGYDMSAES